MSAKRKRAPKVQRGKRKPGAIGAKASRKGPTTRQLLIAWLVVVVGATAAWYVLVNTPNVTEIERLERELGRAESRLSENERRVAELNALTEELVGELSAFEASLEAFDAFAIVWSEDPVAHLDLVTRTLADLGVEVRSGFAPDAWQPEGGRFLTARYTVEASATFAPLVTALRVLERGRLGTSVQDLTIAKIGGDPNDPVLDLRLTLSAHARTPSPPRENP